ncbi:hypothetical protein RQX22_08040 [Sphingosinicella sp. GR2756]|uniref:Uncharacterized protein n=1 Tax=Sphingosinicella rhizophila TaxID=3050082 RepID=A0ABU3Q652_9SPHN|nr:hypothetical protein [Sphingosinicella sp. GR2756]MDT9598896.1 hypothetical protein [Sphingosinicella sp. GR2756]
MGGRLGGYRQNNVLPFSTMRRAAARDEITLRTPIPLHVLKLRHAVRFQIRIHYKLVIHHNHCLRIFIKCSSYPLNSLVKPDIILVRQEYDFTATQRKRLFKILYIAQVAGIPMYLHVKGSFAPEGLEDADRTIV